MSISPRVTSLLPLAVAPVTTIRPVRCSLPKEICSESVSQITDRVVKKSLWILSDTAKADFLMAAGALSMSAASGLPPHRIVTLHCAPRKHLHATTRPVCLSAQPGHSRRTERSIEYSPALDSPSICSMLPFGPEDR